MSAYVPARHLNVASSPAGSCARNATAVLGCHWPFVVALAPNVGRAEAA